MSLSERSRNGGRVLDRAGHVVPPLEGRPKLFRRKPWRGGRQRSSTSKRLIIPAGMGGGWQTVNLTLVWATWLDGLARWTHVITLTCKRHDDNGRAFNETILIDAAAHLIRRLNYKCFGKRARKGESVGVAMTLGWGVYGINPHFHGSFECPGHLSYDEFSELLNKSANETFWINRERCIKTYDNAGWMEYMIEHGADQLIVPLIRPSHFA
jgi:hypothetical protein